MAARDGGEVPIGRNFSAVALPTVYRMAEKDADLCAALRSAAGIFLGLRPKDEWPHAVSAEALLGAARQAQVMPIVCDAGLQVLPQSERPPFREAMLRSAAQSLRLVLTAAETVGLLNAEGIETLLFKGPAWAQRLYGKAELRDSVDIDLFVRRKDARRAVEILSANGFRSVSAPMVQEILRRHYSLELAHPRTKVVIDLQWSIANGYCRAPFNDDELLRRSEVIELDGRAFRTFDRAMMLYLLVIHGAKNSWSELRALVDLSSALRKNEQEWQTASEWLHRLGLSAMLATGVQAANALLSTPIPSFIHAPKVSAQRTAAKVIDFWRRRGSCAGLPPAWDRFRWDLRMRRWPQKVSYIAFRMRPTKSDRSRENGGTWLMIKRLMRSAAAWRPDKRLSNG
ncbi:MAG: nucleotidyltransferase family protein [candidate division KSB1 bacterium]|nr:nucleotidyltransferase family protein [candidate division KSB1 bacterium]